MKANEFVKNFGWDAVKDMMQKYPKSTHVTNDACVFINSNGYKRHAPWFADDVDKMVSFDDLKRLVEAHEIIKLFKSLDHAKAEVKACEQSKHSEILVKLNVGVGYIALSRVKQAIADVESCQ